MSNKWIPLLLRFKLGLLFFFFVLLFLFQERRCSQALLFLFFFGTERRVWISCPAGVALTLGKCSVAVRLFLVVCVFTWEKEKLKLLNQNAKSVPSDKIQIKYKSLAGYIPTKDRLWNMHKIDFKNVFMIFIFILEISYLSSGQLMIILKMWKTIC